MKTVLKYPGSKWKIASQLVNLIPEHGKPRTEVVWMNYGNTQMSLNDFLEVIP